MSRSNPTDNTPNPCTRWFEWDGAKGEVRYYDKEKKQNIVVPDKFTFMLLDELNTVGGWHEASDSKIFSNEVRDTKQETFVVKSFKGGVLAEGFYAANRDRIAAIGGYFMVNLYIAYRDETASLLIGSLRIAGAALGSWVDFRKHCSTSLVDGKTVKDIYAKAIRIDGYTDGQRGAVKFRNPKFKIVPTTPEANLEAAVLDKQLQSYLTAYLARTKVDQVEHQKPSDVDYSAADAAFSEANRSGQMEAEQAHVERESPDKGEFIDDSEIPF